MRKVWITAGLGDLMRGRGGSLKELCTRFSKFRSDTSLFVWVKSAFYYSIYKLSIIHTVLLQYYILQYKLKVTFIFGVFLK